MNRQIGANLASQNAILENSNLRKDTTFQNIFHPSKDFVDKVTCKTWREGVTGKIHFSIKIANHHQHHHQDEEKGDKINSTTIQQKCSHTQSLVSQTSPETLLTVPISESLLYPPLPTMTCSVNGYERISESDGMKHSIQKSHSKHNISGVQSSKLYRTTKSNEVHSNDASNICTNRYERKMKLFVEIEKCTDLRPSLGSWFRFSSRKAKCPFVVIRLNGKEVGRTPAMKYTKNPVWIDQCFEFPICPSCSSLCLEVWDMIPFNFGSKLSVDGTKIGDFLGQTSIAISSLFKKKEIDEINEYINDLKRWRNHKNRIIINQGESCLCPDTIESVQKIDGETTTKKFVRVRPSYHFHRGKRKRSMVMEKPNDFGHHLENSEYKVPNPYPFRRKDIRETAKEEKRDPIWASTSFKGIALIAAYLSLGVCGYSFVFEYWSIKNSIYFSVVTFTTVGYGDLKPQTDGGKLFCCVFALSGIGIIGIALGYIGQNLVQAQVMALEKTQKRLSSKDKIASDDNEENSSITETVKDDFVNEETVSMPKQNLLKTIALFVCPIVAMTALGSFVVGYSEGWDWVDSLYWCIITGTTVGFGDLTPRNENMKWFSVIFIPLSVGVISASLGRIANIFVEKEIAKANKRLLNREVTLEDLEEMNADGDGEVSLLEFVEHMLKSMHKVDQTLLDELHKQFEHLDADGSGGLQQDDIEILTERKLSERRQEALQRYNESLLVQTKSKTFRTSKIIPKS